MSIYTVDVKITGELHIAGSSQAEAEAYVAKRYSGERRKDWWTMSLKQPCVSASHPIREFEDE